ncbi:unnamed protein product [Danaus chrysippus]|uniref:(African queen) hypothetical protein n=1 Tax=Danaus chrysippus TaxID=151541 RepID=A0A8J2VT63_9NEOP|nr:unnamed protein product [Danaus chrysippus]
MRSIVGHQSERFEQITAQMMRNNPRSALLEDYLVREGRQHTVHPRRERDGAQSDVPICPERAKQTPFKSRADLRHSE